MGKRFLESIGYRGIGSAEFKRDERDGELKLIELNPRYWQQAALAERCGVNFPLAQYLDLQRWGPGPSDTLRGAREMVELSSRIWTPFAFTAGAAS